MQFLLCDMKRIFSNKKTVLLCVISPIIVVLVFATIVAPMLITSKSISYNLAICNKDNSPVVTFFIDKLLSSAVLEDIINVYPVQTKEIGENLVKENKVSAFVYISECFFSEMQKGNDVNIDVIYNETHALESYLIAITLKSALSTLGQSENVYQETRNMLLEQGLTENQADDFLKDSIEFAIMKYMSRRAVLGEIGVSSPWGEYLPLEFYLGALFSLFAALSMLPLIHFSNKDTNSSILTRGLLTGNNNMKFYFSRLFSGMLFIFLVIVMIIPTAFIINFSGNFMGSDYNGNYFALLIAMLVSSVCYSSLAIAIGTLFKNEKSALWAGFFTFLMMGIICNIFIPNAILPEILEKVGRYLPLTSSERALASGFFIYNSEIFWIDILKLFGFTAIMIPIGILGFSKRRSK